MFLPEKNCQTADAGIIWLYSVASCSYVTFTKYPSVWEDLTHYDPPSAWEDQRLPGW